MKISSNALFVHIAGWPGKAAVRNARLGGGGAGVVVGFGVGALVGVGFDGLGFGPTLKVLTISASFSG